MLKKGNTVRLKQPVIQGEIVSMMVATDGETLLFLVRWTSADGQVNERHFTEAELEQVAVD